MFKKTEHSVILLLKFIEVSSSMKFAVMLSYMVDILFDIICVVKKT